jgi:hypothetical protein
MVLKACTPVSVREPNNELDHITPVDLYRGVGNTTNHRFESRLHCIRRILLSSPSCMNEINKYHDILFQYIEI